MIHTIANDTLDTIANSTETVFKASLVLSMFSFLLVPGAQGLLLALAVLVGLMLVWLAFCLWMVVLTMIGEGIHTSVVWLKDKLLKAAVLRTLKAVARSAASLRAGVTL